MAWKDRLLFRLRMLKAALTLPRIAGAEDDPPKDDPKPDDDPDPKDDPKDDPEDDKVDPDDDWKSKSRKNESRAKKAEKHAAELEARLKKIEDEGKSEQEKALAKAKEEARKEAEGEFGEKLRATRLESAVTRFAARGFEIGDGDEKETVRFADSDDALVYVERGIAKGEIDADEIFDDEGKVQSDALKSALAKILESKEHLRAGDGGGGAGKPKGDPDRGKGKPAGKTVEDLSPAEWDKRIRAGE